MNVSPFLSRPIQQQTSNDNNCEQRPLTPSKYFAQSEDSQLKVHVKTHVTRVKELRKTYLELEKYSLPGHEQELWQQSKEILEKKGAHLDFIAPRETTTVSDKRNYVFNPLIHHPNVGMIEVERGMAACVLLNDGRILTNLHSIFDVETYATHVKEFHKKYWEIYLELSEYNLPERGGELWQQIKERVKQELPFMQMDNPVDQYFDKNITFSFFDSRSHELKCFKFINISEGMHNSNHVTGLPLLQNNPRLQQPNWDFAILDVSQQLGDLTSVLGSTGFKLPDNFDDTAAHFGIDKYKAPYFGNIHIPTPKREIAEYNEEEMDSYGQTKNWSKNSNPLGASGNISLRKGSNIIHVLVDSQNSSIFAAEIRREMDCNLYPKDGDSEYILRNIYRNNSDYSDREKYDPNGYENLSEHFFFTLKMDPLVMKPKKVPDIIQTEGKNKNTELKTADISNLIPEIRKFYDSAHSTTVTFLKVQVTGIKIKDEQIRSSIVIRNKDKYLAGIEFIYQGKDVKIGDNLSGYTQVSRIEYPHNHDEIIRINMHPFSMQQIEQQLNNLNMNNEVSRQRFFDYFIQILEISKLPIIEKLNFKMVNYELQSSKTTANLINEIKQQNGIYELHHYDEDTDAYASIIIPSFLEKLPLIMGRIKANYNKLININKKALSFEKFIEELNEHLGSSRGGIIDFIKDDLYPILEVLGILEKNYKDVLESKLFEGNVVDAKEILDYLSPYQVDIKSLFIPRIHN